MAAACGAVVASALSCQRAVKPVSPTWRSIGRKRPANDGCGQSDASATRVLSPTGANASSPVPTSSTPISARSGRRAPANDSATSAWKPRGCDACCVPGEHGHDGAVDLHRRAAHAARVAQGDEHHRRVAMQTRAEVLRLGNQRRAVVPGRDQARLQHVAVDLEDAAVARLDGDVALDVERRRRRAQLEVAPLGDGLPVLALALGRFPRFAAVALDHRADERLRRRQAGGDAALGLAQAALALGDDAADGLQGEAQGDDDAGERRRLAEEGKAPDCHGCAFLTGLAADLRRGRKNRPPQRRKCEGDVARRPRAVKRR